MKKATAAAPSTDTKVLPLGVATPRVARPRKAAPTLDQPKSSTSAEVRRLLALADKLTNTAQALRKEAAAKMRQARCA